MTNVDPITLQVIGGALHTIAKEMGHVLYRMSYSSIIRESEDLGAGLFDRDFNTLCESDSTPMHIGSIPGYLRGVERTMHGDWRPGDVVLHNHPYHGASHVPDICCIAPVFFEGELVGFSANTAHHVDLGAASPGIVIDIPDVYAEGMLFSGIKLYEEGKLNRALWQHIQTNTRVPRDVSGDIEAQVASAELGVRRFRELFETYGKATVEAATAELIDYSERMLRRRIREIPDGDYVAEGFLDDDGVDRETRLPVKVTVSIRGDSAVVDTTGSSPQVPTAYNVPFEGSTKVTCYFAFRALLLDTYTTSEYIPQNEGSFRPIEVISPAGSIFNPTFPAACQSRFSQCQRLVDLISAALAPVIPDKVTAGCGATLSAFAYSGVRPGGDYWILVEINESAYGGRPASDGPDSIDELMRNTRNNPIEDLGMHLPLICDRYELRDDVPPGAGRYRGGLGIVKVQRFLTPGYVVHEADRHEDVPWGFLGGEPGTVGKLEQWNAAAPGEVVSWPAKVPATPTETGDCIAVYTPGGGGYGDPLERPADQVRDDVADGYYSQAHAYDAYGVVMNEALSVDLTATEVRRAELRAAAAE